MNQSRMLTLATLALVALCTVMLFEIVSYSKNVVLNTNQTTAVAAFNF